MSDYSDIWYEMSKDQIKRNNEAEKYRKQMVREVSPEAMIQIMFEHHISNLDDYDVIKLGEQYLKE